VNEELMNNCDPLGGNGRALYDQLELDSPSACATSLPLGLTLACHPNLSSGTSRADQVKPLTSLSIVGMFALLEVLAIQLLSVLQERLSSQASLST
jgi:hypothetical protein